MFQKNDQPCYRCIFEEIPESGSVPNCSQAGIIGAVAGNHWMYSGIRSDQVSVRNREIADRQDACDGWINDEYKGS